MSDLSNIDFNHLTPGQFEEVLPDLFAGGNGKVSEDPRLQKFLGEHPEAEALVRDLETIAEHAKSLFEPTHEPSGDVWENIQRELNAETRDKEDGKNGEAVDLSE